MNRDARSAEGASHAPADRGIFDPMARMKIETSSGPRGSAEAPAHGLRASRLALGEGEVIVFSYPAAAASKVALLTPSEREVAQLVLAGHPNASIAELRGTSLRTVSKQLDAIYRKLGVHSRAELAASVGDHLG